VTIGPTFADVLARAKAGDPDAFEVIYRDVSPLVLGYLRGHTLADPEDTCGEVFVSAIRRIGTFEGDERQFRSWLLTIAHRRMVDATRRTARQAEDPYTNEMLAARADEASSAEGAALERLDALGIVDAIGELTELQRSAVLLRVLADLPVREIALIMNRPESAVKALLRRGTMTLSRRLRARADSTEVFGA